MSEPPTDMTLMRVTAVDYLPRYPGDDYDPRDLTVRVVGRTADEERIQRLITGCRPHCYVPIDKRPTGEDHDFRVLDSDTGYQGVDTVEGGHQELQRLTLAHPKGVGNLDDAVDYRTWEADIPFYRRVTWDHDLAGYIRVPADRERCHVDALDTQVDPETIDPIEPRVAIGDIEVVDGESRDFDAMKHAADAPISAATWYDTYTDAYSIIVVDPDGTVDGSAVKAELRDHWGDHDRATDFVDDADLSLTLVDSETDLLNVSLGWLQRHQPDLTAGWNWVDFDWYYLLKRAMALDGVDVHDFSDVDRVSKRKVTPDRRGVAGAVRGLPAFDQMAGLAQQTHDEWRSSALEFVASDQLGVGKIPGIDVPTAYDEDRSRLAAYNLLDVQLTVALTDLHGIEEFWLDMADTSGVQLQDTWSEKRLVDGYIGSRRDSDRILPTTRDRDIPEPAGGLVLTPGDGIYENVAVLDLKSLYPSGMLACNISPETMVDDIDAADVVIPGMPAKAADVGGRITTEDINWTDDDPSLPWSQRPKGFTLDHQGIIADFAGQMFPERERFKQARDEHPQGSQAYLVYDNRQGGVKIVHNSMFGVENSDYFRFAKAGVGDAITGVSRYVLWRAAEFMRELGYPVVYGDTDSVMVQLADADEDITRRKLILRARGLKNELNTHMTNVADAVGLPDTHPYIDQAALPHDLPADAGHAWAFEFEKLYDKFLQAGSKKRYAGTLVYKDGEKVDGKLDVTGFEAQRSDWPERTAVVQRGVLSRVLDDCGFSDVSGFVREHVDAFDPDSASLHEFGVPWGLNKPLAGDGSYGNLPRARAARYSNQHLDTDYGAGDDFRGYYVRRTPSFVEETDVIALDWTDNVPDGFELARQKTMRKTFETALRPILGEVGWTFSEVRTGKRNQAAADSDMTTFDGNPWIGSDSASESASAPSDGGDSTTATDDTDDDADGSEHTGAAAW